MPSLAYAELTNLAPLYSSQLHWLDDQGQPVALQQWQGRPVFLTMAFSTCKKFCPMAIARLKHLQQLLDERHLQADFVIISYDPAADNPKNWTDYRHSQNIPWNNWHFLTGSLEDTKAVSQLLGMEYWLYDDHVLHNFKIVRLGNNGEIVKTLDWDSKENIESLIP